MPMTKQEGVKYVCFADVPFEHEAWEFRYAYPYGQTDPRRVARMYKILSHVWFPGSETVWLDGRGYTTIPITTFADKYRGDVVACRRHKDRDCIYEEATTLINQQYEDSRIVDTQMRRYVSEGFPEKFGLHETGCLYRDNKSPMVRSFNSQWHSEVVSGSKRDQLSFDYIRWKTYHDVREIDRKDVNFLHHRTPTNATQ